MTEKNPMSNPVVRAKQKATLRAMGWKPPIQGGNGKPIPVPQQMLACVLGWQTELAVCTNQPKGCGYPTAYKIDIGEPTLKVAIEVDGGSHCSKVRQAQDRKKEELLIGLGWKVLRFSNKQVMEHLEECVQTVLSII
jgi:hypothetical protein